MTVKEFHDRLVDLGFEFWTEDTAVWSFIKQEDNFEWAIYITADPAADETFTASMFANPNEEEGDPESFDIGTNFEKVFEILNTYKYEPCRNRKVKFSVECEMDIATKNPYQIIRKFIYHLEKNHDLIKIEDNSP